VSGMLPAGLSGMCRSVPSLYGPPPPVFSQVFILTILRKKRGTFVLLPIALPLRTLSTGGCHDCAGRSDADCQSARDERRSTGLSLLTRWKHRTGKPVTHREPENATGYYTALHGRQAKNAAAGDDFQTGSDRSAQQGSKTRVCAPWYDIQPVRAKNRLTIADAAVQFVKNQSTLGKAASTVYGYTRAIEAFATLPQAVLG